MFSWPTCPAARLAARSSGVGGPTIFEKLSCATMRTTETSHMNETLGRLRHSNSFKPTTLTRLCQALAFSLISGAQKVSC
eukprot:6081225-Prymnesium_polylepis.1